MDSIEQKVKELREMLLDKEYPLGLDEILGQIEYLYEDDEEISKVIDEYIDDYYEIWNYASKYYKIKEIINEK